MPTYEYECGKCHRVFEVRQRISEPPLTTCDECGGAVHRLLSAAPFILKGDGWYVTDYPSESRKKAREAEKPAASDAKPAADKSESKSEKKSEKKSESKSEKKSSDTKADSTATTPSASASSSTPAPPD